MEALEKVYLELMPTNEHIMFLMWSDARHELYEVGFITPENIKDLQIAWESKFIIMRDPLQVSMIGSIM